MGSQGTVKKFRLSAIVHFVVVIVVVIIILMTCEVLGVVPVFYPSR
jgi:hypothetical protein